MNTSAMFKIGYGLYVLTAAENGCNNGCIINTVMQITSSPLRVEIAVNKSNYTHDIIVKTGKFNLSVITESASFDLFKRFGFVTGRETDKFADYAAYARSANGLLYITESVNAYLSCNVVQQIDAGTHALFIADVVDAEIISDEPSATYDYYHANIKPAPEKPKRAGWRCKICGYIYEGDTLPNDYVCPLCKHGSEDFEKIDI